jgi:hypothetical protein
MPPAAAARRAVAVQDRLGVLVLGLVLRRRRRR